MAAQNQHPKNASQKTETIMEPAVVEKTASRGRGRPPKDPSGVAVDPTQKAIADLEYTANRACAFINDGATSVAARSARAARAGIPRATVDKALAGVMEAFSDLQRAVDRAYSPPAPKPQRTARVTLS